jgi:IS66 C-terminal element
MYTLIRSAKLNGVDPEADLSHVLARIADHPITRIKNSCHGTLTFLEKLRSTEAR